MFVMFFLCVCVCSYIHHFYISVENSLFVFCLFFSSPENKTKRHQLCGGFTRISSKLPRIPLRRQKLPKVVGRHCQYQTSTLKCPSLAWLLEELHKYIDVLFI